MHKRPYMSAYVDSICTPCAAVHRKQQLSAGFGWHGLDDAGSLLDAIAGVLLSLNLDSGPPAGTYAMLMQRSEWLV